MPGMPVRGPLSYPMTNLLNMKHHPVNHGLVGDLHIICGIGGQSLILGDPIATHPP